MTQEQLLISRKRKQKAEADVKSFYFDTIPEEKRDKFIEFSTKYFKELYDEIQGLKEELKQEPEDFQIRLYKINRFEQASKELILKVAIRLI